MGILKWRRCICDPLDGLDKENLSEELTFEQASDQYPGISGEELIGGAWLVCWQSSKEGHVPGAG